MSLQLRTNQRQFNRSPYTRPVILSISEGPGFEVWSLDLSEGGMLLFSERPVRPVSELKLRFAVEVGYEVHRLNLKAKVRHIKLVRQGCRFGVQFKGMNNSMKSHITKLLQQNGV